MTSHHRPDDPGHVPHSPDSPDRRDDPDDLTRDDLHQDPSQGRAPHDLQPAVVDGIEGERSIPSVNAARSMQSRMTTLVALGVFGLIAAVFLYWYYTTAFASQREAQEAERRAREARTVGDVRPPRLQRTDAPAAPKVTEPPPAPVPYTPPPPPPVAANGPPPKTPAELERERLLSAGVTLRQNQLGAGGVMPVAAYPPPPPGEEAAAGPMATNAGPLANSLRPTSTPAVRAQILPDRRYLLPKGAFVDCTLETALDSTLPGLSTCITPVDIFSADGTVVLIERGTRFVGETRAEVRQGQARIGVLWNEARTPNGVSVAIASPGTDELGRAGLPGYVDRHFWERFGSAILISVIDGAIQTAVAAQREGGSAPIYTPNTSRDVLTEVLRSTVNIPPTIVKNQGERIQILVARDVDFRPVYTLRTRE